MVKNFGVGIVSDLTKLLHKYLVLWHSDGYCVGIVSDLTKLLYKYWCCSIVMVTVQV